MFVRPEDNYEIADSIIDGILKDEAQPLSRISSILPNGATVLDIGAGSGLLARVLKKKGKQVEIDGIEPNAFAANLAKPFYRDIYVGFAQDFFKIIQDKKYDYVVLADVIEHIQDPAAFLNDLLLILPKTTKIFISIPNIAFGGVSLSLINGKFEYVDSGLLERTHLRFFTLATAIKLFETLQLGVEKIYSLERSFYRVEFQRKDLKSSLMLIVKLANNSNTRAYQYLFLLKRDECITAVVEHHGATARRIILDALNLRAMLKEFYRKLGGK